MSSLYLHNLTLLTGDPDRPMIDRGALVIRDGLITVVAEGETDHPHVDRVIDGEGGLAVPGWINAHHHLYSTLARGYAPPGDPPKGFVQILERLWWKLDRALTAEDVYLSTVVGLMDAVRAGCTTVIDHHASPSCADGSLDVMAQAFRDIGLSGCLCYEVSDRNREGEGIEENVRFLEQCRASTDDQITGLFGLHASMTLGEATLAKAAEAGKALGAGFHVHIAEGEADGEVTRERFGKELFPRFAEAGIAGPTTLFAHGIHLSPRELDLMKDTGSMLVTNPESNQNNGLAHTPLLEALKRGILCGLGTDGMSCALPAQARAAYLLQRGARRDSSVAFVEAADLLTRNNPAIARRWFKTPRGKLAPGHAADVALYDYNPITPLTAANAAGHVMFGLPYAPVSTTIARGRVVYEHGTIPHLDVDALLARSREHAAALWQRVDAMA
jgi:putative selenium metabolism protein SsnA